MSNSAPLGPSVFYVEPVGAHRGMHYYDFELCPALCEAGADVTLLTCDETSGLRLPDGLPVEYPFRGIYGKAPSMIRGVRYLRGLWSILWQMRRRNIDLAHYHYCHFPPVDYLFFSAIHHMRRHVVMTAHDVVPFNATASDVNWLRRIYALADGILVHAESGRNLLIDEFGTEPDRVTMVPHGPFLHFADEHQVPMSSARGSLGLEPDARVVLFFGQIKKVKGLDYLIRAFAQVAEREPKAVLVIAGPEWKESFDGYWSLIEHLGLADRVRARIEYVPDDEMGLYFCAANVVALPYTESYQSGVLNMACSFRRPVASFAVGGLAEVVESGSTGLLVPPRDLDGFAAALENLLADPAGAAKMGQAARKAVETKFGWAGIAQRTVQAYASALAAGSPM